MEELIVKMEHSLKECLNINVKIFLHKEEIIINGLENNMQELEAMIFIHGFIAGWDKKDKKLFKICSPEVG